MIGTPELTARKQCHLVEVTPMPSVRYSLNLGYLHAAAADDPVCRKSFDFMKHIIFQAPGLVDEIDAWLDTLEAVDVLAISVYFWNRGPSMYIADAVKKRWPECTVIMGGNDVSHQTDAVFAESSSVDYLVHGEGELTFCELLSVLESKDPEARDKVHGISFRRGDEAVTTPPRDRITDLSVIPSPLLSGVYQPEDIRQSRIIILETNRGCPYSCAFCYWGGATKSKVRPFPMERIKEEITYIITHADQDATLFLADANFGILPQDVEIAEWLAAELKRLGKRIFLFTNWAKNTSKRVLRIAEILYSSNLIAAVTLSAQSFTQQALQIAKRSNIRPDYYRSLQEEFQSRGIPTYTELIWGMPGESLDTFIAGLEYVISSGGYPVVYPLLLLNNTEYTTETFRADHSVRTRYLPYQATNPEMRAEFVVEHALMPEQDWLHGMEFRLSLALFHGCLLRGLLRVVSHRTGRRVVDLCMILTDFLKTVDTGTTLGAVIANHREIWLDPTSFDTDLVTGIVGTEGIPEHLHYQALIRLLVANDSYPEFIRAAAAYLFDRMEPAEVDPAEYAELVEYQVLAGHALAGSVSRDSGSGTIGLGLTAEVYQMLVDVGQLNGVEEGPLGGTVQIALDPSRFVTSPVDSLLLAIYHGSVQVARSFQSTPATVTDVPKTAPVYAADLTSAVKSQA
ncbi:radical SAM protein [Streptomyces sasae]|uniref:radical SAM protein n=1 Tax=Streptomyces sasae TaxID=1266772 RepID=UPI00292F9F48|nr:radical SAM protein [Streptomyces sasae]